MELRDPPPDLFLLNKPAVCCTWTATCVVFFVAIITNMFIKMIIWHDPKLSAMEKKTSENVHQNYRRSFPFSGKQNVSKDVFLFDIGYSNRVTYFFDTSCNFVIIYQQFLPTIAPAGSKSHVCSLYLLITSFRET